VLELRRADGYHLSSDRALVDLPKVHHWLSTDAYWAMGRSEEQMRAGFEGSEPYGVYLDGDQVAFARVITDNAIFAYLCDVYVDRAHRGRGVGGWLVESMRDHLIARGLRRFLLATKDAHTLYARYGFVTADPERWMECDLRHTQRPEVVRDLTVSP
jgi:GNAT superfamily N-acetyltransferase